MEDIAGVSLPLSDDGNRSSFRNIVLYRCLEFRTIDKVHKPRDPEWHTPSLEPLYVLINKAVYTRDSLHYKVNW
jgi:hypothetical protein